MHTVNINTSHPIASLEGGFTVALASFPALLVCCQATWYLPTMSLSRYEGSYTAQLQAEGPTSTGSDQSDTSLREDST